MSDDAPCEQPTPSPGSAHPMIARLQDRHFAALDEGDFDAAADTLRAILELRQAARELRNLKKEELP